MLLTECLARLPDEQIQRMARFMGLTAHLPRRELEERLAAHLLDLEWLTGQATSLEPDEWQALKVVYWGGGGQGITVELCHQVVNLLSGRRRQGAAQALLKLMDRGLIYTRKQAYREVYFIPAELMPTLQRLLAARMAEQVAVPPPAGAAGSGAPDLVEELYRFLAYVYRQEVPLTQQGIIFKRHLRALADLLGVEGISGGEDDLLPGRYPEPLGFLTGFCLDYHLVVRAEGVLRPGQELAFWLHRPESELRGALFDYWEDRYYYPDLQSFLHLARSVPQHWISVPAAARELEPVLHPSQRAPLLPRLQHHLNHFLGPLRLFDLAHDPEGNLLCRLTEAGRILLSTEDRANRPELPRAAPEAGAYQFVLQPTGELIAPRPLPLPVLWQLEVMADLEQRGPALVYRLSRDTVYRALQAGYTGEGLADFLRRHSRTGLPQNLAFDIGAWGQAYGQVYFQEACLLRCSDPVLAQQVKASRRTGRFIRGEVSPTALVFARADYDALLQGLQADGLLPRPGIERPGEPADG